MVETIYRLPGAPRLALLADLHGRPYDHIISSLQQHKPSLTCLAGDFIYGSWPEDDRSPLETQELVLPFFRACATIAPTFLSLGNHEQMLDAADLAAIEATGVVVLDNCWVERDGLVIGGLTSGYVTDYRRFRATQGGTERYPKKEDLSGIGGAVTASQHQPETDWMEDLEGVKNNKGKQVSASQVKSILANEVYKGDLHICKSVSRNVITGEPDAEQYGKYIECHHEAIVGADLWAKAQKRLEAEARPRKDKSKEIDELEMDILAMAEDGWSLKEIAERLGTSVDVVRTCEKKLKAKGWLKEEMSKKQEIETRIETVYQAVKEGHQVGIGSFLGMKSGEVRYALTKLEKAGRVRKEDGAWVAV